jgi:hypothetical protein
LLLPNKRSMSVGDGGHWQRIDFGTRANTWSTWRPHPDHLAMPHLRQLT